MQTSEITISGRTFEVHAVTGKVAAANKQLETRVSGGGGGGGAYQGTGYTAPVRITSTTVTHDQVFLVDTQGREHALRLQDWNLTCRESHEITAIWLIRKGKSKGPYVAIHNATLDETQYNDRELAKLHRPLSLLLVLLAPVILHFSMLSFLVVGAGLGYRWHLGIKGRNELKANGRLLSLAYGQAS